MKRLTEAQSRALKLVNDAPGKSTNFYRDFDVRVTTLEALEQRGLVVGKWILNTMGMRQWSPLPPPPLTDKEA